MTLVVSRLRRSFGDRVAVDDLSLRIDDGERYGLLGPNGAGKTTAISMICGLLRPDAGRIMVGDREVTTDAVEARREIGFVPQEIAVYGDLTAAENLRLFGRLHGSRGAELDRRVAETLELLGLAGRAHDRAETFSGGMQRRLNIGIGLLHRPSLLVLDEPTVGVDPQSRNAILDAVERLAADGMSLLYTTHYMEEAERLCDRVGILDEGVMIAEGSRRELVAELGQLDRLRLSLDRPVDEEVIRSAPGVADAVFDGVNGEVSVDDARHRLTALLAAIADQGAAVRSVEVIEPDLEAVFLHLTGRALRDGGA